MASAVRTAADLGATVINISSVACGTGPLDDGRLGAALAYAVDVKDAVVVTAAGNAGGAGQCPRQSASPEMTWDSATVAVSPAWYDDYVLTVGSVDDTGAPSAFSLAGPWVDVAAPGENMVSLNPGGSGLADALPVLGRAMPLSGTSYAAPVVSGLAALIRARFPTLTARQVMQRIEATAHGSHGGWDPVVGTASSTRWRHCGPENNRRHQRRNHRHTAPPARLLPGPVPPPWSVRPCARRCWRRHGGVVLSRPTAAA